MFLSRTIVAITVAVATLMAAAPSARALEFTLAPGKNANPWLFINMLSLGEPNVDKQKLMVADEDYSGEDEWLPIGQFCGAIAAHWLKNGPKSAGVYKFRKLSKPVQETLVRLVAGWGSTGNKGQHEYAVSELGGKPVTPAVVGEQLKANKYGPGTMIWLASAGHVIGIYVKGDPGNGYGFLYEPENGEITPYDKETLSAYTSFQFETAVVKTP